MSDRAYKHRPTTPLQTTGPRPPAGRAPTDRPRPNFFIAGAPKCGTTAMHSYLKQHPQIFMPEAKEIHFFGQDLAIRTPRDTLEGYLARFEGAAGFDQIGEAAVWYLYSETAAAELYEWDPDAKILIMLRDPVDLIYSQHSQAIWNALGDEDILDFEDALAAEPERRRGLRIPATNTFPDGLFYREIVQFTEQVRRFQDTFPAEQLLILLYDDFKADTLGVVQQTLEFLGVDPNFEPEIAVVNANKHVRSHGLRTALRYTPEPLKRLIPDRKRFSRWLKKKNTRYAPRPPMKPATRASLQAEFAPELERLGELLGRDLTRWTQPRGA